MHTTPKAQLKWEPEFECGTRPADIDWNFVYTMPYRCTLDTKTHYLHFRFIHRILPANDFLYKIGFIDDDRCTFCKIEEENMKHIMWSCKITSKFWDDIFKWMNKLHIDPNITYREVCFGIPNHNQSNFINMIILLAKRYIYRCKIEKLSPGFVDFKKWIIFTEKVEKHIAKNKGKYGFHIKKWEPLLCDD